MGWWQSFVEKAKKSIKLSVTDPSNFQELWSVTSTRIRLISLFIVLIFALGIGMSLLVSWLGGPGLVGGNKSIERKQLEEQYETIAQLTEDLNVHKKYVAAVRRIYSGEVPVESNLDSLVEDIQLNEEVRTEPSAPEKEISKKVKDAMRTGNQESRPIPYFSAPVSGVVSDTYQGKTHPGIDIVTEKDASVQACLSGTVVYSGYSREDGYILIMDHGNGYISIYKHTKKILKKSGDKVKIGDPIAIVGNTGENSTGPHLHFELWFEQTPVNPQEYIQFKR